MKILISGGSGFIGSYLNQFFYSQQHEVIVLSRNKAKISYPKSRFISSLDELHSDTVDVVINLAGAPIDRRWTESYKQQLINSRVETNNQLVRWMKETLIQPKLFIAASAIGYYGGRSVFDNNHDEVITEQSPPLPCFTSTLCQKVEESALQAKELAIRTCIIRLGVVLAKDGGIIKKMIPSFQVGLGGKIASGKQMFSWVHMDDVIRSLDFLIQNKSCEGIFNITAPNPVSNKKFTKAFAQSLNKPAVFTIPSLAVKILFAEMGNELLLKGQNVIPARLLDMGFKFNKPTIEEALKNIK